MADAAAALLASLDERQSPLAHWSFPSDEERRLWFYTPTDHGGLTLADMSPLQQQLAYRLLAAGLSTAGFVTASTIMSIENVLDRLEGWVTSFGRARGRDPLMYFVRVFGTPGSDAWGWRLGGHHLSVNHTILGGEVVASTPCFLGSDPASAPLLGPHPLRPLAGVEDLARDLVCSFDEAQRAIAIVSPVAPTDLVGANRPRLRHGDGPLPLADVWRARLAGDVGSFIEAAQRQADVKAGIRPEHLDAVRYDSTAKGLAATAMTAAQRDMLDSLLRLYVHRLPDGLADAEAEKFSGDRLDAARFLWAGGTSAGDPYYYRVEGPRLFVELDNTQRDANHVHTVWRDPEGDFGGDPLGEHYDASH